MKVFRQRLRERSDWARDSLGLTQESQAEAIGVSRQRLRGWFSPGREPSIELVGKICRVLRTHPNWLMGIEDDPTPPDEREPDLTNRVGELLKRLSS